MFENVFQDGKAHSRIIWDAGWSHDDRYVISASRDKSVKLWKFDEGEREGLIEVLTVKFEEGCTAVAFMPLEGGSDAYTFVVGLESGDLVLYRFVVNGDGILFDEPVHGPSR